MSSSYRLELDAWLKTLDISAKRLLDIGGSQLPVEGRTRTWDVGEYVIADLENPHKDSPQPDMYIDLNGHMERPRLQFDVVFCLEVFDYVYDPVNAFHIISRLLRRGGRAYVSFPFIYPIHQPIEDDALRYAPGGIIKLSQSAGLKVLQIIPRRPESPYLDQFYKSERMRAAKRVDHETTGWMVELIK